MLISPNEHKKVKRELRNYFPDCSEDSVTEYCGADMLLTTNRGVVGIQRKKFPQDFLASIQDGRLSKEFAQLREFVDFPILLLEGKPRYKDTMLLNGRRVSYYSKAGFRNLCRSIEFMEGCYIQWSDNLLDTIKVLKEIQSYFDSGKHLSLRNRPALEPSLLYLSYTDRYLYWLQGLPNIKITRAIKLAKVFKAPIELLNAEISDLTEIPGIGNGIAKGIYSFLRGKALTD